ncbi:MAG: M1 family metallopeptidase [Thermoanaerobaculia bacterium]
MTLLDPHSYFDTAHPRTRHIKLNLEVDFGRKQLSGEATLVLAAEGSGTMDLDTKALTIESVRNQGGAAIPFELGAHDEILGERLRLTLPAGTKEVIIRYTTSPDALALQWLSPEQTEGKIHPFLFSQCQAIHARTMIPLQDTPRVRVSYDAAITIPKDLAAVMSAGPAGERHAKNPEMKTFLFEMPQPIPPYLFALAVGNLHSRDISHRARVWAEPEMVDKAAWEFAGVEEMIVRAESLFGPYEWDRYDMLVLPPSFPYGGMENPRMTFLTPTLIAGDRALVDVIAHELAHSWTGNLVTNATMDHFWLNEGFTTWAERRILEAIHGADAAVLSWAIGQKALDSSVERFGVDSPLTKLRTDLKGVDPDDAFSSIPYEKGSRFVTLLERTVGRETWDRFMREYMAKFRFTSITSEEFLAFLEEKLPGTAKKVDSDKWLHETGMPANAPVFQSAKLDELTALAGKWDSGARPTKAQSDAWSPSEMLVYLQHLPREMDKAGLEWLEENFKLTGRGNYELLVEWLTIAGGSDYEPVFPRIREVLMRVGRMKYLRPLYKALGNHSRTRALAHDIFNAASPTYHSLSRRIVAGLMEKYPA